MVNRTINHFDILAAKQAYSEGKNVTELLRNQLNVVGNTSEIIETAYDLQAGSYIEYVVRNLAQATSYATELASILDMHTNPRNSMLDIGTGELTTLSLVTRELANKPKRIFAFDISWSRLHVGLHFAKKLLGADYGRLKVFSADISGIPLPDKSVSIATSSHALEPNGQNLYELMSELFRVTLDKLVLFEPCYEINTEEGRRRMDKLGYIKGLDDVVEKLGGKVIEKIRIRNSINPLNPTVCFVIVPSPRPASINSDNVKNGIFSVPGTNKPMRRVGGFYFSNETGLCFPVLRSIPILKSKAAILASALAD